MAELGSFILMAPCFLSIQAQGQLGDSISVTSYDDNKLVFGIDLSTDFDEFMVDSPDVGNFHLVTNNEVKLTLKLNYKIFGISAGFTPGFLPGNDDDG